MTGWLDAERLAAPTAPQDKVAQCDTAMGVTGAAGANGEPLLYRRRYEDDGGDDGSPPRAILGVLHRREDQE